MKKYEKLLKQIIRFGITGGLAFIIDYSILYILTEFFHIHYLISAVISFTVSVIFNYIVSINWVFEVNCNRDKTKDFILFIIFSICGLGINQIVMYLFVEKLSIYYMLSKLVATAIVMVWNFITRKLFLENKTNE